MSNLNLQNKLFGLIRESLPPENNIADVVSGILHVSLDSAYRRIRGETPLLLDEAATLCSHFQISFDQLTEQTNSVVFQNQRLDQKHYNYAQFLGDIQKELKALDNFEKKQVIYISKDLPIFHNFYFKPLIAFRYFFWMKIQVLHPEFEEKHFEIDNLPEAVINASKLLLKSYCEVPSVEMWNIESINSTISQIEFSRTSGHFKNPRDISTVYDALESTILHIQEQAENGAKFLPGEDPTVQPQNMQFFFNRIILGDNTIMTITENLKTAFINYGHLNYMMTRDQHFCEALYEDFENLKRRSTQISLSSERQRNIFFNILLSKIRERKQHAG